MKARRVSCARAAAVLALTVSAAVACGEQIDTNADPTEPVGRATPAYDIDAPPDMRLHYGDESLDLRPWTSCYVAACLDGVPPPNPPDVGSPEQIVVEFPVEGWRLQAGFEAVGERCPRTYPAGLDEIEPGRFLLTPAGYADEYDVTLSGRGPGGDAYTTFRWTTLSDGPLPSPSAQLGIVTDKDGTIGSYGVEMWVEGLAVGPEEVDATITLTAADGDSLTFSPHLTGGCRAAGNLGWDAPRATAREAVRLGPAPFTYDVRLTLDGRTYDASATWPDDVFDTFHGYVRLEFSPALPALG
jgi:hypothetical protein